MRKEVLLVGKSRRRQLRKREGKRGANYHRKQNSRERERFKYFWKHLQNGMECKHLPLRKIQWFKTHATPPPLPQKNKTNTHLYDWALPLLPNSYFTFHSIHSELFVASQYTLSLLCNCTCHLLCYFLLDNSFLSFRIHLQQQALQWDKHPFVLLQHAIHTFPTN